jgi:NIMA (never in mitosis gene a)-related kinase
MFHGWKKKGSVGEGSFGAVYLVERSAAGRTEPERAVVKTMFLHSHGDALDPEKVLHEARLLQHLSHPHIVRLLDWTTRDDQVHLLLEYCEGGDLSNRLAALKRAGQELPEVTAISYYAQALSALTHLHARNVLHRDIKSANIFLTGADVIKLGDFGASRPLTHTTQLIDTVVGTPAYFAPELLVSAPYNRQCDVWALGCVLYELLALQRPFVSPSFLELAEMIMSREPAPLPAHRSPMVKQFVAQMLQKDPARRSTLAELGSHPVVAALLAAIERTWRAAGPPAESAIQQRERLSALLVADAPASTGLAVGEERVATAPFKGDSAPGVAPSRQTLWDPTPPRALRASTSGAVESPRNTARQRQSQAKAPPSPAAAMGCLSPPRPPPARASGSSLRSPREQHAQPRGGGGGSSARAEPVAHGHAAHAPAAQPSPPTAPPPARQYQRPPQAPPAAGARSRRLQGSTWMRGIWRAATNAIKSSTGRRSPADALTPRPPAATAVASGARARPTIPPAERVDDEDVAAHASEKAVAAGTSSPPHGPGERPPPAASIADGARAHTRNLRLRNAIRDASDAVPLEGTAPPPSARPPARRSG